MSAATIEAPKGNGLSLENAKISEKELYMTLPGDFKFRLMAGTHIGRDMNYNIRLWRPGMVIHTRQALQKRFGVEKFQRVSNYELANEGEPFNSEAFADPAEMMRELNKDEEDLQTLLNQQQQQQPQPTYNQTQDQYLADKKSSYEKMSLEDLTAICGEEEIPLPGKMNKNQIINKLLEKDTILHRQARGPAGPN